MPNQPLRQLARLYGIETSYHGMQGRLREADDDSLLAVLRALGAPLERGGDADDALAARRRELWGRVVEPVQAVWVGGAGGATLRIPAEWDSQPYACRLQIEDGEQREWSGRVGELPMAGRADIDGESFLRKVIELPDDLAPGYHELELEFGDARYVTLVIVAPQRAVAFENGDAWGVFLPVHAMHRASSWGAGDLGDLEAMFDWSARMGAKVVGCLPLLARNWELDFEPSPYSPSSRLFFDEFYLDMTRLTGLDRCGPARELLESDEFQVRLDEIRGKDLVDYEGLMALKRRVLVELARWFFAGDADHAEFERFQREKPEAERFAKFRAVCRRRGEPWYDWPEPLKEGQIGPGDYDRDDLHYFLYTQWQIHRQLQAASRFAKARHVRWYLDMPLGSARSGYDLWHWRGAFARQMSLGSPPDAFFVSGQNWQLAPLHPTRLREDRYGYFRAAVAAQLELAGMLRMDHVMGMRRVYWIPSGADAADGVYVRYCMDELMAILTLESHRHRAVVVGENLGTVPESVDEAMAAHGLLGMYVLPFEVTPESEDQQVKPAGHCELAGLNTHDLPTFASFWHGWDIDAQQYVGRLDEDAADDERQQRQAVRESLADRLDIDADEDADAPALDACLRYLGRSASAVVLVNAEDLWLEAEQQNRPGTEDPANWKRKARYGLDEFDGIDDVTRRLSVLAEARRDKTKEPAPKAGESRRGKERSACGAAAGGSNSGEEGDEK